MPTVLTCVRRATLAAGCATDANVSAQPGRAASGSTIRARSCPTTSSGRAAVSAAAVPAPIAKPAAAAPGALATAASAASFEPAVPAPPA